MLMDLLMRALRPGRSPAAILLSLTAAILAACGSGGDNAGSASSSTTASSATATKIGHVFVLILENEDYTSSFGSS